MPSVCEGRTNTRARAKSDGISRTSPWKITCSVKRNSAVTGPTPHATVRRRVSMRMSGRGDNDGCGAQQIRDIFFGLSLEPSQSGHRRTGPGRRNLVRSIPLRIVLSRLVLTLVLHESRAVRRHAHEVLGESAMPDGSRNSAPRDAREPAVMVRVNPPLDTCPPRSGHGVNQRPIVVAVTTSRFRRGTGVPGGETNRAENRAASVTARERRPLRAAREGRAGRAQHRQRNALDRDARHSTSSRSWPPTSNPSVTCATWITITLVAWMRHAIEAFGETLRMFGVN